MDLRVGLLRRPDRLTRVAHLLHRRARATHGQGDGEQRDLEERRLGAA